MADHAADADGELSKPDDESAVPPLEPESGAVELESSEDLDAKDFDAEGLDAPDSEDVVGSEVVADPKPGVSHVRLATIAGLVVVVALAALTGWLGYGAQKNKAAEHQRELFLQVGRQGAINLTTMDFANIDSDVQRILDSATGTFYDDFQQRSASFTEVVKQVKSKSVGTVTSAGLVEPTTPTEAQVLVAVTVKSEIVGQPEQPPRSWRMRISVQKVDDQTKVSNVEFVP
jgi:Mce-associated membrane protein